MEEIWKQTDYEGIWISNLGNVKSYKQDKVNGRLMNPYRDSKGYSAYGRQWFWDKKETV